MNALSEVRATHASLAGEGNPHGYEAQEGVPAGAPIHDARARHRPHWPFLYFNEDGRWYFNRAKRRSKADMANDLGEAKW